MEQNREPSNKLINLLSLEKKARIYNRKNTTIFLANDNNKISKYVLPGINYLKNIF